MSATDQLLVVVNPESGNRQAVIDVAAYVLPLLGDIPYQLRVTERPGHAGEIAREFLQSGDGTTILVAGGDGITHEIINALTFWGNATSDSLALSLVIWPGGTANALFSSLYPSSATNPAHKYLIPPEFTDEQVVYKLKSVLAFLHTRKAAEQRPSRSLAIATTTIYDKDSNVTEAIAGVVVASTSLHAAILKTADQLRDQYPGVERFKEAAMRNLTVWTSSDVRLIGSGPTGSTSGIQIYDAQQDALVPLSSAAASTLDGPFAYFLSTVNVDRLEPTFYITAPFTTHPPANPGQVMDIVVVRPKRDPKVASQSLDGEEIRGYFAKQMMGKVFPAAYDQGKHVKARHSIADAQDGETVVEYFRATGWEWSPRGEDEPSRLVCVDGTVLTIPSGGKAKCQVIGANGDPLVRPLTVKIFT